ncbi:MAG: hypothetical protein J0G32_04765 [Alphaproteobacteria bacterium]|nr:hypothetical protein [Alphaproteobacteria bacterium]OJV13741.1 MAG: hypothetical protein BGO27_07060 [Alphaproteobacteria bacterium 33-17]
MIHRINNDTKIIVATFYAFCDLGDLTKLQTTLIQLFKDMGIKGTVLLAKEGINSTISGSRAGIDNVILFFESIGLMEKLMYKESLSDDYPFDRIKVKIKPEIVTFKQDVDVHNLKGTYLNSEEWDALMEDPNAIIIDTRNDFEVQIGTFKNAVNPKIERFTEFATWLEDNFENLKDKKVGMMCTGGIRCEKATAYLKKLGHDEVYHLHGGILEYFIEGENKKGNWIGGCFVFDDRKVLDDHQNTLGLPENN